MKRLLKIATLLLLYCLTTAKSCTNSEDNLAARQQFVVTATRDSIRKALEPDTLSAEALAAFEESARRKVLDLADYLNILSDTTLDKTFRKKAAGMIRGMFISDTVVLAINPPAMHRMKEETVGRLVTGETAFCHVEFDSVKVSRPLHKTGSGQYSGMLSSLFITQQDSPGTSKSGSDQVKSIEFNLVVHQTILGRDTLYAWKVLLGHIH
jgi:hypothetical protein